MADVIDCTECEELAALAVLGALETASRAPLEHHLESCARCRETAVDFRQLTAVLPDSLDLATPSRELRRRVMGAVYGAGGPPKSRWNPRRLWDLVPQGRPFTVLAAAATAAAIVLAVWGTTRGATPSRETFGIVPAATATTAHGQLTYFPEQAKSVLTVTGLPSPGFSGGSSRDFEVWLMSAHGAPVPAALLSHAPGSDTWTAVVTGDLRNYQTVAATIEPPGGGSTPTGPQVFSVPLATGTLGDTSVG